MADHDDDSTQSRDPSAGVSLSLMPAVGVSASEVDQITELLATLVAGGAALGWVDPPDRAEVAELVSALAEAVGSGDAAVSIARGTDSTGTEGILGFAYWTRYTRPTHRPHVDVEKVAVDPRTQGQGIGRKLMNALITSAREVGVEVITLDLRGDNTAAIRLYESLGFDRYGLLSDFVAVGQARYDKLLYNLDLRRPSAPRRPR